MDAYLRLIAAGIRPDCAADTISEFKRRNDTDGLERYINDMECRMEVSDR